jgi:glycosyltransferase involved in cell wall biosynthesis
MQTFKDFEIIISDDSPDNSVYSICKNYLERLPIIYCKNPKALGTPENWNEGIRHAKGQWIKIMHDDDWFASEHSLQKFVDLIKANPSAEFIFSGSSFIRNNKPFGGMHIHQWQVDLLIKDPCNLYYKNFIGPPSVVIHKNNKQVWYDREMKWLVDVDFYMRYLQQYKNFAYTIEPLINVGYSESQVTEQVFHDKNVFVKENLLLFQKQSSNILKRIWNYDYTWRMMRNYKIETVEDLRELLPGKEVTIPIYHQYILSFQRFIPQPILKIGIFSKVLMTISFIISRLRK